MAIKYIDSFDWKDKKVIGRFDFNVPLKGAEIIDTTRIDLALPTIEYLLQEGVQKLVLMSHLGRPKGGEFEEKFSLEPVAGYLAQKLNLDVILAHDAIENGLKELLNLSTTKVVLLENIRFHSEEEKDDLEFAKKLSSYGEYYVNDAFGAAHRKHASTYAIQSFYPRKCFAGFLMKQELESLNKILEKPKKPFVSVVGGAKIADKIKTIDRLLILADKVLIGGAMAYPFLKAKGIEIGKSLCSDEDVQLAKNLLMQDKGHKIELPLDHIVSASVSEEGVATESSSIEKDQMGLDIGPKTCSVYAGYLEEAQTIFWNGPMGLFEKEAFSKGTFEMARAIGNSNAYSVVGGGDSVSAVKKMGASENFSHLSTGGGASLEYLEKGSLPVIQGLRFGVSL